MTNKLSLSTTQFITDDAHQAIMQQELQHIKLKLEQASKTLAQKELIIDSLELDLEHMIDQFVRLQPNSSPSLSSSQWHAPTAPGTPQEMNVQV